MVSSLPDTKGLKKLRPVSSTRTLTWCSIWSFVGLVLTFSLFYGRSGTLGSGQDIKTWAHDLCQSPAFRVALKENNIDAPLCEGQSGYREASMIWNKVSQKSPLAVTQPKNEQEVGAILKTAVEQGFAVTIKGGGHSPAGWSVQEDAVLIDLSKMNEVKVDPIEKTLWAEGGAVWDQVVPLMEKFKLAYVGGECPSVGVVGVALGGGTGWLSRDQGLISDNIISLNLVLPNSTMVEVSQQKNPNLLWALSGAGHSNFGVVTSMKLKLYDGQPDYFAGHECIQLKDEEGLRKMGMVYANTIDKLDDNRLTVYFVLRRSSSKKYSVCFTVFFNGPKEEGPEASEPLLKGIAGGLDESNACAFGPLKICSSQRGPATQDQMAKIRESVISGQPFFQGMTFSRFARLYGGPSAYTHWKSGILTQMSVEAMGAFVDVLADPALNSMHSADIAQIQLNHNGGVISEKGSEFSSFPHRNSKFVVALHGFLGGAPNLDSVDQNRDKLLRNWANGSLDQLQPFFSGAYSNYNDADLNDWKRMYYGQNVEKLESIKKGIQGSEIFRTMQRL